MFLREFIKKLNQDLSGLVPGIKVFGIAQPVIRTNSSEEDELIPGVVERDGEITYVGIDDVDPVRIYHRLAGIQVTRSTDKGYGEIQSDVINTYQMVMIVYINHKRTKLLPEELFLYVQANIPDGIKSPPYKEIKVRIANVITNSQVVYRAEYGASEYKLPAEQSLFQVNYTIETRFKKDCFEKCPTDC